MNDGHHKEMAAIVFNTAIFNKHTVQSEKAQSWGQ